jgi:hypothetical protein
MHKRTGSCISSSSLFLVYLFLVDFASLRSGLLHLSFRGHDETERESSDTLAQPDGLVRQLCTRSLSPTIQALSFCVYVV